MAIQWTGLSPELLIPLDRDGAESLRAQLERGLREAIRSGRLRAGERLPSTRELAQGLGISRGLVVDCFDQLQAEGYLIARAGSATRVSPTAQAPAPPPARPPAAPAAPRLAVDFLPAVPDLGSFPRTDWAKAAAEVCRTAPNAAFDYGDPRGSEPLRTVLAGYLGRVRGAAADPERIVVCTGFSQGLNLSLRALAERGVTRVAFEDPGYDETGQIATAWAGVDLVPVPVDEHGLRVDALAATRVRAVVLTPAHQWPTGVVLSPQRRQALANWAVHTESWVVEDDYDAEFRYDRDPVGMVQGLAPERVINIGTVSKSLAPTMRLGWMLCPADLVDPIGDLKIGNDRGSPGLEQLVLARLIESGRFDRHLRRMRKIYAGKRDALVAALAEHAPAVGVSGLAAGFHAVAHLGDGANEAEVVAQAQALGVGLYGMSPNRSTKAANPPQLVLGFGTLSERAIQEGIARVGKVLAG
ncbi:MAG TPA: PLP-dependent aminotransferase family protein [Streptosporangiaceae bacterium]|jgi:GntR family transcriptional regulator/MocR family aminotransferase